MKLNRREFIKGLMAAAVASQLPNFTEAEAEAIANDIPNVLINGMKPTGIERVGDGWYRIWSVITDSKLRLDLRDVDQGLWQQQLPEEVSEQYTVSFYAKKGNVKTSPDGLDCEVNVWGLQAETGGQPSTNYITTTGRKT